MKINGVNGPIDSADIGTTLIHEHFVNLEFSLCNAFADWFDEKSALQAFKEEMAEAKTYGLKTFVDGSPINLGRDIHLLKKAADIAEIQMLVCTGLYYAELPFFTSSFDADVLTKYLVRDIEKGIQGTDMKAALIKCASEGAGGSSPINTKMLQGTAKAAKETGAPIYTHTNSADKNGLYQQEILCGEGGVDPAKVVIGHSFDSNDLDYLRALIKNGTYIAQDRAHTSAIPRFEALTDTVATLCKEGYTGSIMLSHDNAICNDCINSMTAFLRDRSQNPVTGSFSTLFKEFIPRLLKKGVTQAQIDQILIGNPRRYLEGLPPLKA